MLKVISVDTANCVNTNYLEARVPLLQKLGRAADRATGTNAGNPVGDLAVGLAPDLRSGGVEVSLGIGHVVVLVWQVSTLFVADALGNLVVGSRIIGFDFRWAENHLDTKCLEQGNLLTRHLVRSRTDHLETLQRGAHR